MTVHARSPRQRQFNDVEALALADDGWDSVPSLPLKRGDVGCPATTAHLRPILDLLVKRVEEALVSREPGWIAEIGCGSGTWTEWIAMTMKSHHPTPGESRPRLILLDDSPSSLHSTTEFLRLHCLPEPDAIRICPNGQFSLPGGAHVVFSFGVFDQFDFQLMNSYFESAAQVLRPGGKVLVSLACEFTPAPQEWKRSEQANYVAHWSSAGLKFHDEIRSTLERDFTFSINEAILLPAGPGQVFVEFTRTNNGK